MKNKKASDDSRDGRLDDLTFHAMLGVLQGGMWLLNDMEEFLKPFGISHGRFSILIALLKSSDADILPKEMAGMLGKSKPTITRQIERLRTDGYIRIDKHETDGRAKLLGITEKGKRLLQSIVPAYNERIKKMSRRLSEGDKGDLLRLLGKIDFLDDEKRIGDAYELHGDFSNHQESL